MLTFLDKENFKRSSTIKYSILYTAFKFRCTNSIYTRFWLILTHCIASILINMSIQKKIKPTKRLEFKTFENTYVVYVIHINRVERLYKYYRNNRHMYTYDLMPYLISIHHKSRQKQIRAHLQKFIWHSQKLKNPSIYNKKCQNELQLY